MILAVCSVVYIRYGIGFLVLLCPWHCLQEAGVGGLNPLTPANFIKGLAISA